MSKIKQFMTVFGLLALITSCGEDEGTGQEPHFDAAPQEMLAEFARCLTEQGVVMYGSSKCPACRAQRKIFGESFQYIQDVECDPHALNTQVDRCLDKKIRKVPTWIIERDGKEYGRLESYQILEDIGEFAGCDIQPR